MNYYKDTDERMQNDAAFRNAVEHLMLMASEHGFTPGELKQIAFRAALELEMRRPVSPVTVRFSQEQLQRMAQMQRDAANCCCHGMAVFECPMCSVTRL